MLTRRILRICLLGRILLLMTPTRSLHQNQHQLILLVLIFLTLKNMMNAHRRDLFKNYWPPFWGRQDHTDDYSVDTEDSAQQLAGFHAYDEEDRTDGKEIPTIDEARLIALDQQRLDELFGHDMEAYLATEKGSEEIDEETAQLIALKWMSTVEPDDKSDLLQDMDNLDVAVLITSNIDCDLKCKVPQGSDFQVGQHQN